jgi:uncharacterized FlaG/YvyC family protein
MGHSDGERRARPRYVFQVDHRAGGAVIRILDTVTEQVFREVPVALFLEHARTTRELKRFLFGPRT